MKPLIPTPEQRAKWRVKKLCLRTHTPWPRRGWSRMGVCSDIGYELTAAEIPHRLLARRHRRVKTKGGASRRWRVIYTYVVPHVLVGELIDLCYDTVRVRCHHIARLADGPGSDEWRRMRVVRALARGGRSEYPF